MNRRSKNTAALTMSELLISFVLVLLLLLYTLSSFVSTQRYLTRGREFSTAIFMAQTKMEILAATPMSDIEPGKGSFEAPFETYQYSVTLSEWEDELQLLEVVVTSPRGAVARLNTLRQTQTHEGIIVDPNTNTIVYTKPNDGRMFTFSDITGHGVLGANSPPIAGGDAGALAGDPGHNFRWAVDVVSNSLVPYIESDPEPWGDPVTFPPVNGLSTTQLAGIAMDRMANILYCADWSNRGVWIYTDGLPGIPNGFLNQLPHAPVSPPLGIPSGVATDAHGSLLLVADTENQCLRKLFVDLGSNSRIPDGYRAEELEKAPRVGHWLKERLRHPKGMGAPQGVAMDSSGWVIYSIDRAYLYQMIEDIPGGRQWERFQLPEQLKAAGPSGIAFDEFNNVLYIVAKNGELWKFRVDGEHFARLTV